MKYYMNENLKAPFPYFGGKAKVAAIVWQHLGDVKQYIEPFVGSAAILLKRPPTKHEKIYEIINDLDGNICNVWRSIALSPKEVIKYCDWRTDHIDLVARKKEIINSYKGLCDRLQSNARYHDPKLAGYYIWAASCWIGTGLCRPNQRPHLTGDKGVNSQIPHLPGDKGVNTSNVQQWIFALQSRLRHVKSICGDWRRVCGGNWQDANKPVGIFFDPPYATKGRDNNIYHHDSMSVGKEVEAWCLERGKNPNYRIIIAGYDDEHKSLVKAGWKVVKWSANGGYARKKTRGMINRHRERLYISPHCI